MTISIRLHSVLMRVMLLAGMIPFFLVSDVNAFQSFAPRCDMILVGSDAQKNLVGIIKYCINKDQKVSFYYFYWFDQKYRNMIFHGFPPEYRELIFILNGIDVDFLNKRARKDSSLYRARHKILEENRLKLAQIFSRINIEKLTKNCMDLISTNGCYAEARGKLKLPSLAEIKRRIRSLDM